MRVYLICLLLLGNLTLIAQKNIRGTVKDKSTEEYLIGAYIFNTNSNSSQVTDETGHFSLLVKELDTIICSYIGFHNDTIIYDNQSPLDFTLSRSSTLDEIVILENRYNIRRDGTGSIILPAKIVNKVPTLFGETDVLKTLQLLPGVETGNEGQTTLFVRGGTPGQTKITLDDAVIYNPAHLLSFFSVFNPDILDNFTLYKSGFPSRYSGRVSSYLDVTTKDGDFQRHKAKLSLGLISSKAFIEGPLIKEKLSYAVAYRRTYVDLLMKPFLKKGQTQGYLFWDGNFKLSYKLDKSHDLKLNYYSGEDKVLIGSSNSFGKELNSLKWANNVASINLMSKWSNKINSKASVSFSKYKLQNLYIIDAETIRKSNDLQSGIRSLSFNSTIDFKINKSISIQSGLNTSKFTSNPGTIINQNTLEGEVKTSEIKQKERYPLELNTFIDLNLTLGNFSIQNGLNFSSFFTKNVMYRNFDPRIRIQHKTNEKLTLSADIARTSQYIHLLTNEGVDFPTDVWTTSTENVKPQNGWIYSVGTSYRLNNDYTFNLDFYNKNYENNLDYRTNENVLGVKNWEEKVVQGKGKSQGVELMVRKNTAPFSGWLSYTNSSTKLNYTSINRGQWYPMRFNRRHNFSLFLNYQKSSKHSFSFSWQYKSGFNYSVPLTRYDAPLDAFEYGQKNNWISRPFHKLDIVYNKVKSTKKYRRTWSVGLYNAYSRVNTMYVKVGYINKTNKLSIVESGLFPVIPSISYNIEWL